VGQGARQAAQVFAHQGHFGGLDGHIGAHGPQGDADVGGGQGGGVVDAVADHRGRPGGAHTRDDGRPVLGAQVGWTCVTPAWAAKADAVRALSPVSVATA
jgi:hypothetical protein